MQHLDEGTIHAWLDGALPAGEAEDVERHVRECAGCASLVADARGLIAGAARIVSALDAVPGGVIPSRRTAAGHSVWRTLRLTPLRAVLAASVMLVAASVVVARRAPRTPVPRMRADSASPVAAEARPGVAKANALAEVSGTRAAGRVVADSTREAQAQTAGGVAAAKTSAIAARTNAAPQPVREAVLQLESVVATSADGRALESSGCYQVIGDTTETHLVPLRFALDRVTSAGVASNVVRAVTPDGRRDRVVAGLSWQAVAGADRVLIAAGDRREAFAIPRSEVAERFAPAARPVPERQLRVSRIECR